MTAEQNIEDDLRFVETCVELDLLNETDAQLLRDVASSGRGLISQEAVKRGWLTPSDVDIVQALQNPRDVVPGYEIMSLIGRGGMGVVFRARQIDLDRIVALKTILIGNISSPTAAARFEREAKAIARLQHPNIVQAHNFGKQEGRYYFAMEFVPGRTCEQVIRDDGPSSASDVWFWVRQVASGLLHALRQNLIHRDIKPANLILMPAPEGSPWPEDAQIVKITDFGLAMFADHSQEQMKLTTGEKVMGSPLYMSPEQFAGGEVDFRTDLYALGVTAWHLLVGQPPFRGGSITAIYHEKMKPLAIERRSLPVDVADDQWQLLLRMLDPDPARRPRDYESLIASIDALAVFGGSEGAPTSSPLSASEHPTLPPGAGDLRPVDRGPEVGSASDITRTVELKRSDVVGAKSHLRWSVPLVVVALLAAVGTAVRMGVFGERSSAAGQRVYTQVVGSQPLFDGETLSGWDAGGSMVGAWSTVEAPDSSTAIACTTEQGGLTRRFSGSAHPRISLFVWLQPGGGPIDIDFGFDPSLRGGQRACLRISEREARLGTKTTDFGEIETVGERPAPRAILDRYHVVYLERQSKDWFVFLEEDLVGTVPLAEDGQRDAIRLVVHGRERDTGGTPSAYFAEVRLDDLGQVDAGL